MSCMGKRAACGDGCGHDGGPDFECAVCCDTLLSPVVAPCGHDMCAHCYRRWLQRFGNSPAFCPLCRAHLPPTLAVCLRLERTIDALHPEAVKRRRIEVLEEEAADMQNTHVSEDADERSADALPIYPPGPYSAEVLAQCAAAMAASMCATMNHHALQCMAHQYGAVAYDQATVPAAVHQRVQPDARSASNAESGVRHVASATTDMPPSHATGTAAKAASTADVPNPAGWQRDSDGPERLEVARAIVSAMRSRGLRPSLGSRFTDAVRLIELMLYRQAPTKDAYLDRATLSLRIDRVVRQRLAARRATRGTPATANAVGPAAGSSVVMQSDHVQPVA